MSRMKAVPVVSDDISVQKINIFTRFTVHSFPLSAETPTQSVTESLESQHHCANVDAAALSCANVDAAALG